MGWVSLIIDRALCNGIALMQLGLFSDYVINLRNQIMSVGKKNRSKHRTVIQESKFVCVYLYKCMHIYIYMYVCVDSTASFLSLVTKSTIHIL